MWWLWRRRGTTGDLYGEQAAVIYEAKLSIIDPTSTTTVQALG